MTDKVENEEKVVEKNKFAKDLCFDKIVWIFMISCIVSCVGAVFGCLRYGCSCVNSCTL